MPATMLGIQIENILVNFLKKGLEITPLNIYLSKTVQKHTTTAFERIIPPLLNDFVPLLLWKCLVI